MPDEFLPYRMLMDGMVAMGFAVAALFFLRFWRRKRDRLFMFFSVSFGLMSANRIFSVLWGEPSETPPEAYIVRLLSFVVLLVGIWDKNREKPQDSSP